MKEFISIIMPAYNAENLIGESIESVINQDYRNWELIIINDKATDNTKNIILEYANKDIRIKILENQVNKGVSATRNKGIEAAQYPIIAFIDSDDIWDNNKLSSQLEVFKKGDKFVFTGARYINEKGEPYPGKFVPKVEISFDDLIRQNVISTSSVLLDKKLIGNLRFGDDKLHEDYEFWLKILKDNKTATCIQKPLITYRLYRSSKSGNKLNSIKMSYGVFRNIGFSKIKSLFYTLSHLANASIKYRNIFKV